MFTPLCVAKMKEHALAVFPHEACGLVVRGRYVALTNRAGDPRLNFLIAEEDMRRYEGRVQAIVHSHPYPATMPWPSKSDMQGQLATDVPWAIVPCDGQRAAEPILWGEGVPVPPLLDREFCHGVRDCYSLIRDFYRLELGIVLPEFARDDEWWNHGENMYVEGFRRAGFQPIDAEDARPGDVFLAQIRSPVPNHAGVLRPDSLILHHVQNRLSRHDPIGRYTRFIVSWIRHEKVSHG